MVKEMPTYNYQCVKCNLQIKKNNKIYDVTPDCPACGGKTEKIFLSAPAIHGHMARGRELAIESLHPRSGDGRIHGMSCGCGNHTK